MTSLILLCALGTLPSDVIAGPVPAMVQPQVAARAEADSSPIPLPTPKTNPRELYVWSATWCEPCQAMKPWLADLYYEGYALKFVDYDKNPEVAAEWGIDRLPFLAIRENGKTLSYIDGSTTEEIVRDWVDEYHVTKNKARKRAATVRQASTVGTAPAVTYRVVEAPSYSYSSYPTYGSGYMSGGSCANGSCGTSSYRYGGMPVYSYGGGGYMGGGSCASGSCGTSSYSYGGGGGGGFFGGLFRGAFGGGGGSCAGGGCN